MSVYSGFVSWKLEAAYNRLVYKTLQLMQEEILMSNQGMGQGAQTQVNAFHKHVFKLYRTM